VKCDIDTVYADSVVAAVDHYNVFDTLPAKKQMPLAPEIVSTLNATFRLCETSIAISSFVRLTLSTSSSFQFSNEWEGRTSAVRRTRCSYGSIHASLSFAQLLLLMREMSSGCMLDRMVRVEGDELPVVVSMLGWVPGQGGEQVSLIMLQGP